MRLRIPASAWTLALAAITGLVAGQSFMLDGFVVGGGGGESAGGVYSVVGAVGQPETGSMNAGPFTLSSGFWTLEGVVRASASPRMTFYTQDGFLVIAWGPGDAGSTLEYTTDLGSGAWITETTPPTQSTTGYSVSLPVASGHRYYRLRKEIKVSP